MTLNLLARYEARAKTMTTFALRCAINDVMETMKLHRDKAPTEGYNRKLYAEFDAYTVELYRRQNT